MKRYCRIACRGGIIALLSLGIAACGGGAKDPAPSPGGGTSVVSQQEDQFGTRFATAFRADNNSEPFSPADGDIAPISFTTEPVDIK